MSVLSKIFNSSKGKPEEGKEMSFFQHLEELRWHIFRSVLSIVVCATVLFFFKEQVTAIIFAPKHASFVTYQFFCRHFEIYCTVPEFAIIQRDLGEQFFTHLKTSMWLGFIISFPYIIWEIWRFVKPGLYDKERKAARGIIAVCSLLFFIGVIFGYFVIAPFAISFLAGYTFGVDVQSTATLDSYISYLTMVTLPIGIVFELPVVAYFLAKIGILYSDTMTNYRRHAVVLIFILAGIITPPDVISQFLVAIPLLILYELSIYIVKRIEKKATAEELLGA